MADVLVSLNVRIPPKLRKRLEAQARRDESSLNRTTIELLEAGLAAVAAMRAEL